MAGMIQGALREDPEFEKFLKATFWKLSVALAMSPMREEARLNKQDVASSSGLPLSDVEDIETPYRPLPSFAALQSYAGACGRNTLCIDLDSAI